MAPISVTVVHVASRMCIVWKVIFLPQQFIFSADTKMRM